MFKIGCHVSAAGGARNAPKNAHDLGCEAFQIFSRSPRGGAAPKLNRETINQFQNEMDKYGLKNFVIHCPYYINFGSAKPSIYHGSILVVREELERGSLLGAKYVMTHLGSFKDLGREKGMKQAKDGLKKVLAGYKGKTEFLLEIAAGAGEVIGGTFEDLAELMEPLKKMKGFGGICFDTQHAFAGGYDLRTPQSTGEGFKKFDKGIGLKWLKMSHINDSKPSLGEKKDRHEHIGKGKIGRQGILEFLKYLKPKIKGDFILILETEHDKVNVDIKILKGLREALEK